MLERLRPRVGPEGGWGASLRSGAGGGLKRPLLSSAAAVG